MRSCSCASRLAGVDASAAMHTRLLTTFWSGVKIAEPIPISSGATSPCDTQTPAARNFKVLVFGVASLTDVHWHANGEVVLMALLGGIGTVFGPLAGAFTFVSLQNYLAPLGSWGLIVQGAIFVLCVLLFRDGIMGLVFRAWLAVVRPKKES